jgi:16S rRNA (guanine966-N2)-methyltransferase
MRDYGGVTRIVAGTAGGRRLAVPPRGTRPTSERVREALFSALEAAHDLQGARVVDLYAGSGALGFEALSRGAARVAFVESDRHALDVLRRNAAGLGLAGAEICHGSVEAVLAVPPQRPYDVVLADPPYALTEQALGRVLALLAENRWTEQGSVLVIERASRGADPQWPTPFTPMRVRRYGDTALHWAVHVPAVHVPNGPREGANPMVNSATSDMASSYSRAQGCYGP